MGAWIEILACQPRCYDILVAPLVGAWIEISLSRPDRVKTVSHPLWVRGLKSSVAGLFYPPQARSHPLWVRGLKSLWDDSYRQTLWSHPLWVRGLKSGHN